MHWAVYFTWHCMFFRFLVPFLALKRAGFGIKCWVKTLRQHGILHHIPINNFLLCPWMWRSSLLSGCRDSLLHCAACIWSSSLVPGRTHPAYNPWQSSCNSLVLSCHPVPLKTHWRQMWQLVLYFLFLNFMSSVFCLLPAFLLWFQCTPMQLPCKIEASQITFRIAACIFLSGSWWNFVEKSAAWLPLILASHEPQEIS